MPDIFSLCVGHKCPTYNNCLAMQERGCKYLGSLKPSHAPPTACWQAVRWLE